MPRPLARALVTHGNGGTPATPDHGRLLGSKLVREGARRHRSWFLDVSLGWPPPLARRVHAVALTQTGSPRQSPASSTACKYHCCIVDPTRQNLLARKRQETKPQCLSLTCMGMAADEQDQGNALPLHSASL